MPPSSVLQADSEEAGRDTVAAVSPLVGVEMKWLVIVLTATCVAIWLAAAWIGWGWQL